MSAPPKDAATLPAGEPASGTHRVAPVVELRLPPGPRATAAEWIEVSMAAEWLARVTGRVAEASGDRDVRTIRDGAEAVARVTRERASEGTAEPEPPPRAAPRPPTRESGRVVSLAAERTKRARAAKRKARAPEGE